MITFYIVKLYNSVGVSFEEDASLYKTKYAPGDKLTLGNYGGEDISWIVLESYHGKYLVISEKGLDAEQYAKITDSRRHTMVYTSWLYNFYDEDFSNSDKKKII